MINFTNLIAACESFNWYGFLIGGGMVICIILSYYNAKKRGFNPDLVFEIAIICIPLALVGARLYYVIFSAIEGREWTFVQILGWEDGKFNGLSGLAIYGGLIGAVLGGVLVALWHKKKKPEDEKATFLQMADLAFAVIILGQAIGRWGNFANQEAYGNEVVNSAMQWFPYAVEVGGKWYQATFFYESMWNLVGFALLFWMYAGKRKSFDGFVLSVYCIFYGVGRFFIEGLRSDSLYLIPGVVRISQVVSVIIVLFGIVFILYHVYKARTLNKKPFIMVPVSELNSSYLWYEKSRLSRPPFQPKEKEKKKGFFATVFGKSEDEAIEGEAENAEKDADGNELPPEVEDDITLKSVDINEIMSENDFSEQEEIGTDVEADEDDLSENEEN